MKNEIILASKCGAVLGKYILTVERNPVDPDYSRKVTDGKLRTSEPIYLYAIKPIQVEKVEMVVSANNVKSVQYNGDPNLRLPLAGIDDITAIIPKPTTDAVRKAISKLQSTGEQTIFVDYVQLTKEVNALNTESKAILTQFINEQMKFINTFDKVNEVQIANCKLAMADEGIDVSGLLG